MDGILLVDKPAGWTSHDVVAKVRNILKKSLATSYSLPATPSPKVRVGHTGTLDPMATGLLVLVVGSYTKRASEFSKLDKVYEAEITLGATSTTGDKEGKVTQLPSTSYQLPSRSDVDAALNKFIGQIQQVPPAFSAIKVGGQRAYKLARAGKTVEIEPRKITIYQLLLTNYQYPKLCITARVSSGTYIRSLAEDIGKELRTGAYLTSLRRTQVGNHSIANALSIDKFTYDDIVKNVRQTSQ